MRVSHGCVRMQNEDITFLFSQIAVNTPVQIIDQPVKAGWYGGQLFLEVHPPLDEHADAIAVLERQASMVLDRMLAQRTVTLDEEAIARELIVQSGIPVPVSLSE